MLLFVWKINLVLLHFIYAECKVSWLYFFFSSLNLSVEFQNVNYRIWCCRKALNDFNKPD